MQVFVHMQRCDQPMPASCPPAYSWRSAGDQRDDRRAAGMKLVNICNGGRSGLMLAIVNTVGPYSGLYYLTYILPK